jgi:hypothetical protein
MRTVRMNKARRCLAAGVALAATAVTLASVAAAGEATAKQRVTIKWQGASGFTLTPLTAGVLERDAGTVTFCCWHDRTIVRDGLRIDTGDPRMTLVGKKGTLVANNQMEFRDVPGGYAVFTGTWKVVSGTGVYAGVSGGGHVAGIQLPSGDARWQREGFLRSR